jgi:hypothetical protein
MAVDRLFANIGVRDVTVAVEAIAVWLLSPAVLWVGSG